MKFANLLTGRRVRTERPSRRRNRSLFTEPLEDRQLLTAVVPGFSESVYSGGLDTPNELAVDAATGTIVFGPRNSGGPFYRLDTDLTVTPLGGIPGGHAFITADIEINDGLAYTTNFSQQLVQIDPATGLDTILTTFVGSSIEQGIAFKNNVLYANSGNIGGRFWSFDLNTAQLTMLATNFPGGARGLEYVASTDQFFMATAGGAIFEVFETGAYQFLYNAPTGFGNMAVDAAAEFAYATIGNGVVRIDLATGQVSQFLTNGGAFTTITPEDDLAFGPASSGSGISLYVTNFLGGRIVEISGNFTQANLPPVAAADDLTTNENTLLNGNVLVDNGNGADLDPNGDPLTVTAVNGSAGDVGNTVTLASGAGLTLNADGTFDYQPAANFSGTDTFEYTIGDGNGGFDSATVTITVVASDAEIHGAKWSDTDGDGVRDVDELPLEGTVIYLDLNDNGMLDPGGSLEPDDFAPSTVLNTVNSEVTLSVLDDFGNTLPFPVTATTDNFGFASTGSLVFGHANIPFFNSSRRLRMDFSNPVDRLSIDFSGGNAVVTEVGRLEIYDASATLLDTYVTQPLAGGEVETMTLSRASADISFAIAFTEPGSGNFGRLDNLAFGVNEPSTATDADGQYWFTDLAAGDYVVREVVPDGFQQTFPATGGPTERLFAVAVGTVNDIVEVDPATGAEINRFAAPTTTSGGPDGLAFDGTHVWFINGAGDDTLYQLEPDTGAVIDADVITAGSGFYTGLAALNGKIYILDFSLADIFEFDPATDAITNQLNLAGIGSGLAGITGPDRLVSQQGGLIVEIDPATGAITNSFPGSNGFGFGVVDGQIYTNAAGNIPIINIYNRAGVIQGTITLPFGASALGADDIVSLNDGSHHVTLSASEVVNALDFGNQALAGQIHGAKFQDLDGDGRRDADEPPLEGVTIYLDLNDNGVLDAGGSLEPDDFSPGTLLDTVDSEVTLSVLDSTGSTLPIPVTATIDNFGFAPTGSQVFAHANVPFFNSSRRLRMDFTSPVDRVSIDFAGGNTVVTEIGRLEIYNASGTLLDTYLTQALAGGEVETMTLSRATADIAFAIAFTEPGFGNFGRLDNLAFGTVEPSTTTNADGEYWFMDLLPGDYVVREVVPDGFIQTAPGAQSGRLFATSVITNPDEIVELDPETGATLNRFAAPTNANTSGLGLAFDGVTLFFVDFVNDTLFELDPDDGAILDSTVLPASAYDGIAELDGLIYLVDFALDDIQVFDPDTNAIVNTLDINGTNPTVNLQGGLGEYRAGNRILATTVTNDIVFIDPTTGQVTSSFTHGGPFDGGVAGSGEEVFVGFSSGVVEVFSPDGTSLRSFNPQLGGLFGLGASDETIGDAHRVTLDVSQILVGLDFGNQRNDPPTAVAGGPYVVPEGGSVMLNASASSDPNQPTGTLTFLWDLDGDGMFGETGAGATRGDEVGISPTFVAAGTDGPDAVTVDLRVVDAGGLVGEDSANIDIFNVSPVIEDLALDFLMIDENGFVELTGMFSDPGIPDTHEIVIEWGDGRPDTVINLTAGERQFSAVHQYLDDNPTGTPADQYVIGVRVTDDDDGEDEQTIEVLVRNVAPIIQLDPAGTISENETLTLTGTFTDPGLLDEHDVTVDWDDPNHAADSTFALPATSSLAVGDTFASSTDAATLEITALNLSIGKVGFSVEHLYLDDGPAPGNGTVSDTSTIIVTVEDDDGNAAPIVWATQPATGEILKIDPATGNILDSFPAPDALILAHQINGLTIAENGNTLLYVNGGVNGNDLYRLDPDDGTILSVESLPGFAPVRGGLSFETGSIDSIFAIEDGGPVDRQAGFGGPLTDWTPGGAGFPGALGGDDNGRLFLFRFNQIQEFSTTASNTQLNSFPLPPGAAGAQGLAFDGVQLYLSDAIGNLFTLDPDMGALLNQVNIPSGPLTGLGADIVGVPNQPAATEVIVRNVAPVVQLDLAGMIFENETLALTGAFTDPGLLDEHDVTVGWDDPNNATDSTFALPATSNLSVGDTFASATDAATLEITALSLSTGKVSFSVEHQYLDDGPAPGNGMVSDTSTISVTVEDDDANTGPIVWATQPTTGQILKIDPLTGTIVDSFAAPDALSPNHQINGLTIAENGNTLLYVNGGVNGNDLYRLDPDDGTVLSIESLPGIGGNRGGLSFDSGSPDSIFAIDDGGPVDRQAGFGGTLADWTPPGALFPGALGGDDNGRLFLFRVGQIQEFSTTASNTQLNSFPLPPGALGARGLAFDGVHLYLSDVVGNVFTLDPDTGAVLNQVNISGGPLTGLGADIVGIASEPTTTEVLVKNVDPVIDDISVQDLGNRGNKALPGEEITLTGLFRDIGILDEHTVIVDWGATVAPGDPLDTSDSSEPLEISIICDCDGGGSGSFTATHTYDTGGIYTITVTVIDDDTGQAIDATTEIFVSGVRVDPNTGELQIVGTSGKDIVVVKRVGGSDGGSDDGSDEESDEGSDGGPDNPQIKVTVNFDVKGESDGGSEGGSDGGGDMFLFDLDAVTSIHIVLCEGDDHANVGHGGSDGGSDGGQDLIVPTLIEGDAGNDHLTGGAGADTILGGDGMDKLKGRDGDDVLIGGAGDDNLDGGQGNDVLSGGDGNDKLNGNQGLDLLIGGLGKDDLKGGGGSDGGHDGGDILIAGWTVNDNDPTTLRTILDDAWFARLAVGDDYDDIVDDLVDDWFTPGVDVFDDGVKDKLAGSNKSRDVFFADTDGENGDDDKITGSKSDHIIELDQLLGP